MSSDDLVSLSWELEKEEEISLHEEPEPEPEVKLEFELKSELESERNSSSGSVGSCSRGLTLDRMPYDILYLIIQELCKPIIPLRSGLLQEQIAPHPAMAKLQWRSGWHNFPNYVRPAIRQLRELPLVCKAFYDPAMALIYKYIPFSFHNPNHWSRLAEFWSRPANGPVMGRIRRLNIVFNPETLDRWNFDSRYAHVAGVKNHLDGIRHLPKILECSLADLSELKELDISIPLDGLHEVLGTPACEMEPSWNLLTSLKDELNNRFDNLTTLGLRVSAYDLALLLRSVSSELCAHLRTFDCTLSACNAYGGFFELHEDPTDAINAFVKRCPNLTSLSLPYLSKGLQLHPDNTGLKELIVFEGPEPYKDSRLEKLYLELIKSHPKVFGCIWRFSILVRSSYH